MDWDFGNIQDCDRVCYDGDGVLKPITEQLILYCKKTGIPAITPETAEELLVRIHMVADVVGDPLRTSEGLPYRIDAEDVLSHVGLTTTAQELTAPQFYRKIIRVIRANAEVAVEELKAAGS